MKPGLTWEVLIIMLLFSGILPSFFVAVRLWSVRNGKRHAVWTLLALGYLGNALHGMFRIVAECFGYVQIPIYTTGSLCFFWASWLVHAGPIWIFAIWLFSLHKHKPKRHHPSELSSDTTQFFKKDNI